MARNTRQVTELFARCSVRPPGGEPGRPTPAPNERTTEGRKWMAPMGIGTIQPRWRGVRGGCHPAQSCARYARAPKSVICLKVSQEITRVPISGKTRCGLAPVPPATFLRRAVLAGTKWRPLELAMVAPGGKGPPISDEHLRVPLRRGSFFGAIYRAKRSVGARPAPSSIRPGALLRALRLALRGDRIRRQY